MILSPEELEQGKIDAGITTAAPKAVNLSPQELQQGQIDAGIVKPSLSQKVSADFTADQAATQAVRDKPTSAAQIAQMIGQGGKIVSDVGGDVGGAAVNALVPDNVQAGLKMIGHGALNVLSAGVPQGFKNAVNSSLQGGAQAYGNLPQPVQDVAGAVGNTVKGLATVLPAANMIKAAAPAIAGLAGTVADAAPGAIGSAGDALVKSGQNSAAAARQKFVQDLVSPLNDTKAAKVDAVGNTTVDGLTQKATVQPTNQEIESANNVAKIADVKPGNTVTANRIAVNNEITRQAKDLSAQLDATGVNYMQQTTEMPKTAPDGFGGTTQTADVIRHDPVNSFHEVLDKAVSAIPSDATLTGNAQKTASALADKMHEFVDANPPTPAGLLDARKQFDSFIESQKKNAFTDEMRGAFQVAKDVVRKTANNYVADTAPGVPVKESLASQSSLFRALENIDPKAAKEAPTILGRLNQRIDNVIPGSPATKLAVKAVGVPIVAPLAAAGAIPYAAAKLVTAPATRIIAGKTLQEISKMSPSAAKAYLN